MEKDFLHQELEVAQAGADIKEGSRGSRTGKIFTTVFFSFSILLTIAAVAFTICFFISEVDGSSMMLTLNATYPLNPKAHDSVLVNKYAEPKCGDIIIVRHYWETPRTNTKGETVTMEYFIKRLIGTGGDRIRFNKYSGVDYDYYKTVVNDIEIDERYLSPHWGEMVYYGRAVYNYLESNGTISPAHTEFIPYKDSIVKNANSGKYEIVLKPNEIFFMGDNRGSNNEADYNKYHSYDCTSFGPQPRSYIEGVRADTIKSEESLPEYVWKKIKQFFSFRWLFG